MYLIIFGWRRMDGAYDGRYEGGDGKRKTQIIEYIRAEINLRRITEKR